MEKNDEIPENRERHYLSSESSVSESKNSESNFSNREGDNQCANENFTKFQMNEFFWKMLYWSSM